MKRGRKSLAAVGAGRAVRGNTRFFGIGSRSLTKFVRRPERCARGSESCRVLQLCGTFPERRVCGSRRDGDEVSKERT